MPHIMARLSAHTRAVMAVLPCGMAKGHSGNPAASLRVERLYDCPLLLSGLSSLVLKNSELTVIHHHYKVILQRIIKLIKLHQNSPECVVMFLSVSLPATALVHLGMLGLLGMIARLGPNNILHKRGIQVLLSNTPGKSWFTQIRSICQEYGLQDPLITLQSPSSKDSWKSLTKSKVIDICVSCVVKLNICHPSNTSTLLSCPFQPPIPCGQVPEVHLRSERLWLLPV